MEAKLITKSKLKPDANQPRKSFDLDGLVDSIKERGILVPLIVTPDFTILDGERRWRASNKIEELKELPCFVVDQKEYDKPDKRLELQLIVDEMREDYNAVEKAEAYQRYINAGHSQQDLATLLKKSHSVVKSAISILSAGPSVVSKLREDDKNWTFHADVECKLNGDVPKKQKENIHKRVLEGAFNTQDELRETLAFAKSHPVHLEEIAEAKDASARTLVMLNAEPIVKDKFKPKGRKEMNQVDIDKERLTQMLQALNNINSSRILWSMTDAIEFVKKTATKEQKEAIIKSIEMIVKVWTKTLSELKK